MSVYVSTTYLGDGSRVDDALKDLETLNIKNIELGSNHAPLGRERLNVKKNTTYIVHNYFPPTQKDFILNIASSSPVVREKSISFIKNSVNWCKKKKIKYYTIHPGFLAEAISPLGHNGKDRNFDLKFDQKSINKKNRQRTINQAIKIIELLYKFAQGKTHLLIENQGSKTSKEYTIFDSIVELQLLKESIGEKLEFNFNLAHAELSGINLKSSKVFNFVYKNSPFFELSEISGIYDSHLPVFPKKGVIGNLLFTKKTFFRKRNIILEYRNIPSKNLKSSFESATNFLN